MDPELTKLVQVLQNLPQEEVKRLLALHGAAVRDKQVEAQVDANVAKTVAEFKTVGVYAGWLFRATLVIGIFLTIPYLIYQAYQVILFFHH